MTADLGSVELADVVRYAGASGDFNPIHWDVAFARAAGHPDVFSMGALHAGWLLSELLGGPDAPGPDQPIRIRVRFHGTVGLGESLTVRRPADADDVTAVLLIGDRPVVTATITPIEAGEPTGTTDDEQRCTFPIELGAARQFARAVHWTGSVEQGSPVPPTFLSALTFFLPHPDPIERVGFERARTLLGETSIELFGGPMRVGEEFSVRERVTNHRTKQGSRGTLELTDVVAELTDASSLRVRYTNTFVLTPDPASVPLPPPAPLRGSKDPQTGEVFFPARRFSVDGTLREVVDVELSSEGRLWSWTVFDGQAYGQIDLAEGVRVQGPLSGDEHRIGDLYRLSSLDATRWCFSRA